MKYTKVKDLNLSDDVLLALDTMNYVSVSLDTALSGMNFQICDPDNTPLRNVINDLSICLQGIIARFGGKLNGQNIVPDMHDKPDEPDSPTLTKFFVTFCDYDGTVLLTQQIEEGHAATAPQNPVREGYIFIKWDRDFSNVHENLVIHAVYREETTPVQPPSPTKYTVVFRDWNGDVLKRDEVEEGHSATPPNNPTRIGHRFISWSADYSNVHTDVDATAQYDPCSYHITFDPINGQLCGNTEIVVSYGQPYGQLPSAYMENYSFDGWFFGEIQILSSTILNTPVDHTLSAQWKSIQNMQFTVKFYDEMSSNLICSLIVENGDAVTTLPEPPQKIGHHFDKWLPPDIYSSVHNSISVYASYKPNYYTVTFDGNGGIPEFISTEVIYGQPYGKLPSCSFDGKEFNGWISGSNSQSKYIVSSDLYMFDGNQILCASWSDMQNELQKFFGENYQRPQFNIDDYMNDDDYSDIDEIDSLLASV